MSSLRNALVAITAATLALSTADASAQARRVVIRAPSRSLSLACTAALGGHTFSFNEDAWYSQARASLRDPANFGPTGTVRIEFVFGPPFDALRPEVLDGADLLVLNPYSPMPQTEELRAFGAYTRQGVGFVSFQNAAATFFASAGRCVGEGQATLASAAGNPVLQGPFGAVSSPYFTGYNCSFTMLDPMARALSSNSAGPNGIMIDLSTSIPRAGRAVSFGDEEHFGSLSIAGCGVGTLVRGNNNDTLLRNVFAWVGETAHDPIPSSVEGTMDTDRDGITDDLDGDTDNDGVLDGFEAGDLDPATPPIDTDRDGRPDYKDDDSDNDGIVDTAEHGGSIYDPLVDTDNDGSPDARDLDSDNDGLADAREPPGDANNNGVANIRERDSDSDGLIDGMGVIAVRASSQKSSIISAIVSHVAEKIIGLFLRPHDPQSHPTEWTSVPQSRTPSNKTETATGSAIAATIARRSRTTTRQTRTTTAWGMCARVWTQAPTPRRTARALPTRALPTRALPTRARVTRARVTRVAPTGERSIRERPRGAVAKYLRTYNQERLEHPRGSRSLRSRTSREGRDESLVLVDRSASLGTVAYPVLTLLSLSQAVSNMDRMHVD